MLLPEVLFPFRSAHSPCVIARNEWSLPDKKIVNRRVRLARLIVEVDGQVILGHSLLKRSFRNRGCIQMLGIPVALAGAMPRADRSCR